MFIQRAVKSPCGITPYIDQILPCLKLSITSIIPSFYCVDKKLLMFERNHQHETQGDDTLTDQHAGRLPGTKVGNLWEGMRTHAEDVCQAGKDRKDITGGDQARTNI